MAIKGPARAVTRPPKVAAPHEVQQTGEMSTAPSEHHGASQHTPSPSAANNSATASNGPRRLLCASVTAPGESLLTARDILTRLSMTSADPAKWMRRIFNKHDVPYLHAGGKVRSTEAQYRLLLERITFFPSVPDNTKASTISEFPPHSTVSASTSKSSVQERVTRMLRRT